MKRTILLIMVFALTGLKAAFAMPTVPVDKYQIFPPLFGPGSIIIQDQSYGLGFGALTVDYDGAVLTVYSAINPWSRIGPNSTVEFRASISLSVPVNEHGIAGTGSAALIRDDGKPLMFGNVTGVGWYRSFYFPEVSSGFFDDLQIEIASVFVDPAVSLGDRLGLEMPATLGQTNVSRTEFNPWRAPFSCGIPNVPNVGCQQDDSAAFATLAPSKVPEPPALLLLVSAFAAIGFSRKLRGRT